MKRVQKKLAALIAAFAVGALCSVAQASDWDVQPTVKKSVAPTNPDSASGMVMAMIEIDASGKVTGAVIDKSTDTSLEAPVLAAVSKWIFEPAKKDGQAVACKIKVPFQFKG